MVWSNKFYISRRYLTPNNVAQEAILYADSLFDLNKIHEAESWCDAHISYIKKHGGCQYFDKTGCLHRDDGPAVELLGNVCKWFYKGTLIPASNQENFKRILKLKAFL